MAAGSIGAGSPIGIQAIFVNGDLCDDGGGYKTVYDKGSNLIQLLADLQGDLDGYPLYVGLGNHDLVSARPGMRDFFRQQMWGFHRQWCNTKEWCDTTGLECIQYVTAMNEGDLDNNLNYWQEFSQNWLIDADPVVFFQLHRYGLDTNYDHASGSVWLKQYLSVYQDRPIVIVQHMGFDAFSRQPSPDGSFYWTQAQQDDLMSMFSGFNVIGVFHGHTHNPQDVSPPYCYYTASAGPFSSLRCFCPGSIMTYRRFGLARIVGTLDSSGNYSGSIDAISYSADDNGNPIQDTTTSRYQIAW